MEAGIPDIIKALEEIAVLLELQGANTFKVRAYHSGVRILRDMDAGEFEERVKNNTLIELKGIGKALAEKIGTLAQTGDLPYLTDLRAEFPDTLPALLQLGGLGPKKVKLFYTELGVASIDMLEKACQDGSVAALPGCGQKTADNLLAAIEQQRSHAGLFLYPEVKRAADAVIAYLGDCPAAGRLAVCGSVRRGKEMTKDCDLLAASDEPQAVIEHFTAYPDIERVLGAGETKSSVILANGLQVDLRVVPDATFANTLHHFTGSKDHNVAIRSRAIKMGMKVSEWGLFRDGEETPIPCVDEAAFFKHLGLHYIPPELREDRGEFAAAELSGGDADPFAGLVVASDYRGVLHCHTTASDGTSTIEELVAEARKRGHAYLGITDHSRSSFQANGLSIEHLEAQNRAIRELRGALPDDFTLFSGIECDILGDGSLDYPDELLEKLDFVIVSIHNGLQQARDQITGRIIKAIEHPASRILAHPTGRLLLKRDESDVNLDKILDAAAANNVAIEFNCQPSRMDLDWRLWHKARDRGILCSLNPDAHRLGHFDLVDTGLLFCRKAKLTPAEILNCLPVEDVKAFFG
jgi:DNA polymerase (family 10)